MVKLSLSLLNVNNIDTPMSKGVTRPCLSWRHSHAAVLLLTNMSGAVNRSILEPRTYLIGDGRGCCYVIVIVNLTGPSGPPLFIASTVLVKKQKL